MGAFNSKPACQTAISSIENGVLRYHGFSIEDLAPQTTFEETIYLLWYGRLPNRLELDALKQDLVENAVLPARLYDVLRLAPSNGNPMAKLRTCVSFLTHFDDEALDHSLAADHRKAIRIMARIPAIVAAIERSRKGLAPLKHTALATDSLAETFLWLLTGEKPSPTDVRALDICFVLHAEHELNASTFAARVTASTLSDVYSGIVSALGALKGPLHGNANEQVANMLAEIGDVQNAAAYIDRKLANKELIMGFGHRVYKNGDPRVAYLQALSKELADWQNDWRWYDLSVEIARLVQEKKGLLPNVDFYAASVYSYLGIPRDLYTPVFAISRTSGWLAHILEQHGNNRLIRPRAEYVGKTEAVWLPLEAR